MQIEVEILHQRRSDIAALDEAFTQSIQVYPHDGIIRASLPKNEASYRQFRNLCAAQRSFTLARCWLGKALGELGEENPYPESTDPSSPKIEPPSYTSGEKIALGDNAIAALKETRRRIDALLAAPGIHDARGQGIFAIHNLMEAKMLLGEVLGSLREKKDAH